MSVTTILLATAIMSSLAIPRPEHPRPDFERSEWLNLNGSWDFAETNDNAKVFTAGDNFPDKIVVPFCRESKLSGLARTGFVTNVWYRRTFERPVNWKAERTLLHFGACDWRTRVWVNGQYLGEHRGGSASFDFEVTDALVSGENTVVVHAYDDTRSGLQETGKQAHSLKSQGIMYTRTTGIWQTVWLEGVGRSYIKDLNIVPDLANSRFLVQSEVDSKEPGCELTLDLKDGGKTVASVTGKAEWRQGRFVIPIKDPKLWAPEHPFLYDVTATLKQEGKVVDTLHSYTGMREIRLQGNHILLNGKPIFMRMVLDQGFYPDGVWTAPTEEALKKDIELSMACGFNGARLHQKVFEPRFLYWADKLGYMCWGESPNYGMNHNDARGERPMMEEWVQVVRRDRNHPAIIGWCPFNETPTEAIPLLISVMDMTRAIDPTRPIVDTSGYIHGHPHEEITDAHDYDQNPETFAKRWQSLGVSELPSRYPGSLRTDLPFFVSEYGGIGWSVKEGGWGYGNNPKTLEDWYTRYSGLTQAILDSPGLCGFVYTQLTDVEQEQNGLFQFDRTPKFDLKKIHKINTGKAKNLTAPDLKPAASWNLLLPGRPDGHPTWRYTFNKPADDWEKPDFSVAGWSEGKSGFGTRPEFAQLVGTSWTTSDIWLRREFDYDGADWKDALLAIFFDNATEVYLNGKLLWQSAAKAWSDGYEGHDITKTLKANLKKGKNTLAAHVHQDEGGQFFDMAILTR
ncbi:MAG: beta galactosidase jelly roll domain-containing protein [Armatimonadetes bacterium]|nr:beta galactosidase jelly roll domain-containing protein [Armatimonadota bacterium]